MPQIFHPSMNTVAKATIFGAVFIAAAAGWVGWQVDRSPYVTGAGVPRHQPVPFSHEQVDHMPLMYQSASLQMEWCLGCHREPEKFIRPKDQVFNMKYVAPSNQLDVGRELVAAYHVRKEQLTNCSVCHR